MELEISWGRAIRVWWALVWRSLLTLLAAAVLAGAISAVLGVLFGGLDAHALQALAVAVNLCVTLAVSVVPVRLVLGKDFGEFRLVALAKQN